MPACAPGGVLPCTRAGVEQFKAKSFPEHAAITDLFNESLLPHLMPLLLGGTEP